MSDRRLLLLIDRARHEAQAVSSLVPEIEAVRRAALKDETLRDELKAGEWHLQAAVRRLEDVRSSLERTFTRWEGESRV